MPILTVTPIDFVENIELRPCTRRVNSRIKVTGTYNERDWL